MMNLTLEQWVNGLGGWLSNDIYSTAWVALVPDSRNPECPAWPEALDYIRRHQLPDGGWGEPSVLYAHERTIATLAAVSALHAWRLQPGDVERVRRGLRALRTYASRLAEERVEPIGFELLVPRLWRDLDSRLQAELPIEYLAPIEAVNRDKLALIVHLHPRVGAQGTWWFSMEMLPEEGLAKLDDSILADNGSIATSPAATAAYLRALRRAGRDSESAASYLDGLVWRGEGAVPFSYPVEIFERLWILDNLRRAGVPPSHSIIQCLLKDVYRSWQRGEPGLSFSDSFVVNDGDSTSVGFTVLTWGGHQVSIEPLLSFWEGDHIRSYVDERGASVSANVHALTALRSEPGLPHGDMAHQLTEWLLDRMDGQVPFEDKWHISPFYAVSRAIPAFAGWHDAAAERCVDFLLMCQHHDGGWGWLSERSTLEETALSVIGLCFAWEQGLLRNTTPLVAASRFLFNEGLHVPREHLWIGKTLYGSETIVLSGVYGARAMLARILNVREPDEVYRYIGQSA